MTINIEYEAEEKLDLDYEKIITDVVNEAVDYEKCPYEAGYQSERELLLP